jgi:hypothetical protein
VTEEGEVLSRKVEESRKVNVCTISLITTLLISFTSTLPTITE